VEAAQLSTVLVDGSPHEGSLEDQIGGSEVPRPSHESQHRRGERVRRVCHHPEGAPWCDEILQVTLDDYRAQDVATGRECSSRTLKLSAYTCSPAWRMVGHRSKTVCNPMRPSSRASGAPRQ
jgi:hypothetical protein